MEPGKAKLITLPSLFIERDRKDFFVSPGLSLAQHIGALGWIGDDRSTRVTIDGRVIHAAEWERVYPKPNQIIVVRRVYSAGGGGGGGGKQTSQLIAILAVAALAIAAPYLAPLLAAGAGATAATITAVDMAIGVGTWGGMFLTAGIGIGGMLAVNALIPPPSPKLDTLSGDTGSTSPTLSITGTNNKSIPYGPIPRIYGTHRIFPPLAARPFTEISGQKQYIRLIFCCGYGPLEISDMKIGETPLDALKKDHAAFSDVIIQQRRGLPNDTPLPMMPQDVYEEPLNILLASRQHQSDKWHYRRTQVRTVTIGIDMSLPFGLGRQRPKYRGPKTWEVAVEYRLAGSAGAWTSTTKTDVKASATTAFGGSNNDLTFTAKAFGAAGNNVHVRYVHRGVLNTRSGAQWMPFINANFRTSIPSGRSFYWAPAIEISIVQGVTTAAQIKAAIEANAVANALVTVTYPGGNDGSGTITLPYTVNRGSVTYSSADYTLAGGDDSVPLFSKTALSDSPLRYSMEFNVPEGQYDVRVWKTSEYVAGFDGTLIIEDTTYWAMLRSIQAGVAVKKKGMCLIGMRIKATDQLNGVIDRFNCVVTSVLPDYDAATDQWKPAPTSNPASVYLDILTGTATKKPKEESQIDWVRLKEFWTECERLQFRFNAVIDFRTTARQIRQDVLSSGRAVFAMRDMKYSLIQEVAQSTPVEVITPRNSWGFKWTKRFIEMPHALKVRFVDEANNWEQGERVVYTDGYTVANAEIFEETDAGLGVTSDRQVYNLKRREIKEAALRSHDYAVQMDLENITFTRGDRVQLSHDVILAGSGFARIKSLTQDSAAVISSLTLDAPLDFDGSKFYAVRCRSNAGAQATYPLALFTGRTDILTLETPTATAYPILEDMSGNAKSGAITGPAETGRYGPFNKVVDPSTGIFFDGPAGAYAQFGTSTDFDFTTTGGSFTIEMWIYPETFAADGGTTTRLIGKSKDASNSWQTGFGTTGRFQIQGEWANVAFSALDSAGNAGTVLIEDAWNYVVATVEAGVTVSLYVNNKLCTNGANAAGFVGQTTMILGRQATGTGVGRYTGAAADIAWYPLVLTPAQIGRHWAASRSRGQNLMRNSEDLSQTATPGWLNARTSETLNASLAPNHTMTMDKIVEDGTAGASHYVYSNNAPIPIGAVYTFSVYAKAGERSILRIQMSHGITQSLGIIRVEYDLSTGIATPIADSGGAQLVSHKTEAAANGSYRCIITGIYSNTIGAPALCDILLVMQATAGSVNYNGDGVSGLYVWGWQLEPGYTAGEYIPTYGAGVQLSGYHETIMNDAPSGYWRMAERSTPGVGDLVSVGLLGSESLDCIVRHIEMAENFTATVMLQDYAPEIMGASDETIPPYQSNLTTPALARNFIPVPIIDFVQSDEAVLTKDLDGTLHSRIVITLHFASEVAEIVANIEVQYREKGSQEEYLQIFAPISGNGSVVSIPDVRDKIAYEIRLRSISSDRQLTSGWKIIDEHVVVGKTTPPPAPDAVELYASGISWTFEDPDYEIPLDLYGFHVRMRPGTEAIWEDAQPLTRYGPTTRRSLAVFPDGTQQTIMVKAVDTARNESLDFASLVIDPDDLIIENQILHSRQNPAFAGSKVNCSVVSNQLVADDSGGLMWHVPIDPLDKWTPRFYTTDAALFWNGSSKEMEYTFGITPPIWAYTFGSKLRIKIVSTGNGSKLEYRALGSRRFWALEAATPFWTSDAAVFWGAAQVNYYPWLGGILRPHREQYFFRLTMIGGAKQGVVTSIEAYFDFPDKTRGGNYFLPVGGLRLRSLALAGNGSPFFFNIESVTVTVEESALPLTRVRVINRDTSGPLVMGYDDAGNLAEGYISAVLSGY